jgi:hypothetical protein
MCTSMYAGIFVAMSITIICRPYKTLQNSNSTVNRIESNFLYSLEGIVSQDFKHMISGYVFGTVGLISHFCPFRCE